MAAQGKLPKQTNQSGKGRKDDRKGTKVGGHVDNQNSQGGHNKP